MTRRRLIPAALLLALVIAAIATSGFGLWSNGRNGDGLTLYGNVDVREVEMAFRVPGRISAIPVEEGDRVAEGDLLAVLDARPVEDRVGQADASIAEARAALARLVNGNRPQEITAARARLDAAQARLAEARRDVERRGPLAEAGAISRNQWEATQAEMRLAEASVQEARAALSLQADGARTEDIAAARARLASAQAARASTATDLADTRLLAAGEGTLATRAAEPGSLVQPGQTVLTVAIDRPLRIRAYVGEPDLSRVAPGMAVEVTADGNPRTYAGRIGHIATRAEFTPRSVETESLRTDLVYRVRIVIDDPDEGLRQGQPVTVAIPAASAAE